MEIIEYFLIVPISLSFIALCLVLYNKYCKYSFPIFNLFVMTKNDEVLAKLVSTMSSELKIYCSDYASRPTVLGLAHKIGYQRFFDEGENEKKIYNLCKLKHKGKCPVVYEAQKGKISKWLIK